MELTKKQCMDALMEVHENHETTATEAFTTIERLINTHFSMIEHMKATSLYDVYEYENSVRKALVEPMEMFVFDNQRLKKEVNELRKKLGMIEKYKEN